MSSGRADAFHARVFGRVTRGLDNLVERVESTWLEPFATTGVELVPLDARACVRSTARLVVASLVKNEPLEPAGVTRLTSTGAAIAKLGIWERNLVGGVRSSMSAGLDFVLAVAVDVATEIGPTERENVAPVLCAIAVRHRQLEQQIVDALIRGHDQGSLSMGGEGDQSTLVDRLVLTGLADEQRIRREASESGLDLALPYALLIVVGDRADDSRGVVAATKAIIRARRDAAAGTLRFGLLPHIAVLVPVRSSRSVQSALRVVEHVAIESEVHAFWYGSIPALTRLPILYRRALRDLGLPLAASLGPGLISESELAFHRVCTAASVEDKLDFVDRTAGRLLDDPMADDLVATLEAYARTSGSLDRVAGVLDLHENTVRDRIKKITRLTSKDVRKPEDFQQLLLAIRLRHVRPGRPDAKRKGKGAAS